MFAPALDASYHGPGIKGNSAARWFLRQLNMGTLACAMFVALALLSNTQGKDAGPGKLSAPRAAKTQVVVDNVSFSRTPSQPSKISGIKSNRVSKDR
jgi:hypothetical protein